MTLTRADIPLYIHKALHFAVLATLPFTTTLNNRIIILLGVSMFFLPGIFGEIRKTLKNRYFWLFSSPFVLVCIGLLYTDDLRYGFEYVEKNAMLMVVPFVIFSTFKYLGSQFFEKILWAWVIIVFIGCIACHVPVIDQIIKEGRPFEDLWQYYRFNYTYLTEPIGINPGYLALYISFALAAIGFILVIKPLSNVLRALLIVLFVYQFLFLFLLTARIQIGSLILAVLFTIFFIAKNRKMVWRPILAGTILVGLIAILVYRMPNLKWRIIDSPKEQVHEAVSGTSSTGSFSSRFNLLRCGFETLNFKEWVIGHGTGDAYNALIDCYTEKGDAYLIEHQYHVHNEYVNRLMMHGIFGLGALFLIFGVSFKKAWQSGDYIYLIFLILVMIALLPHNFLSTHKGVVFFALMNALLFVKNSMRHDET